MTNTRSIATAIAQSIYRDLDNNPNFTLTHAQLVSRIINFCDDPKTTGNDRITIYSILTSDPSIPIRD